MPIPKLTDVSSTLADLRAQRAEIGAKGQALRTEIFDLSRAPDDHEPPQGERDIFRLLGRLPPPQHQRRAERMAELHKDLRTHDAAAEVLDREIHAEIGRASAIIRERVAPEAKRRLKAVAVALIATHSANAEYEALLEELTDQGVSGVSGLTNADLRLIGHPRNPHGDVARILRDLAKEGVLTTKELPAGLR